MPNDLIGTFQSVILCDDIRREDNGKLILIGVYTGDIVPVEFPAFFSFRLYMLYDAEQSDKHRLDIVCMIDDVEVVRIEGAVSQPDRSNSVQMIPPPMAIDVDKPSDLVIMAETDGGITKQILRKKIRVMTQTES